jgi:hypothetical protein
MGAITERRFTFRWDQPWTIGFVAWDMRQRKCKDDKDRAYALLSLTANGDEILDRMPSFQTILDRLNGSATSFGGGSGDIRLSSMLDYHVAAFTARQTGTRM